jgi:hypothetical protein
MGLNFELFLQWGKRNGCNVFAASLNNCWFLSTGAHQPLTQLWVWQLLAQWPRQKNFHWVNLVIAVQSFFLAKSLSARRSKLEGLSWEDDDQDGKTL